MDANGENASSVCVVCKKPDAHWSCQRKGCNNRYHLHCVKKHQPDEFITVGGGWRCVDCIKKQIQLGAVFECDEVESIWDIRKGKSETIYLVKYKNLAHVHNCWISENNIRQAIPEILAKFNQEYQNVEPTTWKEEWTRPERLLMRRNLMYADMALKFSRSLESQVRYCNTEWLVKWKGLGYEHATWELGSLKCLHSSEAKRLKQEYCHRQVDAARRAKLASEHNMIKQEPFVRLDTFPSGFPDGLDVSYLDSLNELRQFWHMSQNALLIDQEERVIRIILFIKSIMYSSAQPFLILSATEALSLWEEKLRQLVPSVNTVVHTNRFNSSLVEITEFWGQDGHLLFQVLLSNPDAIEDFEAVKQISWETIIVDQCENATHLRQIKTLSADFKLLILNKNPKDDISQCVKLLSFLEPGDAYRVPDISILKEKISRYIVYQYEPDSLNCDTVPLAREKAGALWKELAKPNCCQYSSPVLNPRKRKESPNDVKDLCVSHGAMVEKRSSLEKPTNSCISESSCEHVVTLSMQLDNLSLISIQTDVSASSDVSVGKVKRQTINGQRSKQITLSKVGVRTIRFLLKPRLLRLCEMSGIPESVNSVANIFFNHVLKSHKAMLAPFIIPRSCLKVLLEVDSRYKCSSLNELCEQFLPWSEIAKSFFSPYFVPRLTYYDPPSNTSPNAHQGQAVSQEKKSFEHEIEKICTEREKALSSLQKSELFDLENHAESERRCHWMAHESVIKQMHIVAASDQTSNMIIEKMLKKFEAFEKHMVCQHRTLEILQEKARNLEKLRKKEWVEKVKSGELKESFDFSRIPLPDSQFVLEKFDWVCVERTMNYGITSSQENVLEKLDPSSLTVGDPSSVAPAGALTYMGKPPNIIQQHDITVRQNIKRSKNENSDNGSNSTTSNSTIQEQMEAPPNYTGSSARFHVVKNSQQLSPIATSFMAEETPANLEELPYCDDMLLEPAERETNTDFTSAYASMPDFGVSALSRPDVLSEPSHDLEIPSFTQEMFPNGFNLDPIVNELTRINHMDRILTKKHEEKKSRLKSQCEGEIQRSKRKYRELNKEEEATFRKHTKFLQDLTSKVEGRQTVETELKAFETAAESDTPHQDWNTKLYSPRNSSTPSACASEPAFMNCASFGLSTCMPCNPLQNPQAPPVETSRAASVMTNQAPSVQTNLAPPLTSSRGPAVSSDVASTPFSTSPALHVSNEDVANLGPNCVLTSQLPSSWSDQVLRIPDILAPTCVSTVHDADVLASLGPHMSNIWNLPTQGTPSLPVLNNQDMLNRDTLGMAPSTSWTPSVQKTRAPVVATAPPIQVPHFRADMAAPLWTCAARPTSRSRVPPVVSGMAHPVSNMGTSTMYLTHPIHLHSSRPLSVLRNQARPVHTASHLARPSGSQHAFSSGRMLRAPSPYILHRRPNMLLSRPRATQAPPSDFSYNVPNFGD